MKFYNLKVEQLDKFFDVINSCKGDVRLVGNDINLNLKSNLAKYVSFAKMCTAGNEEIKELEVVASEKEDIDRLFEFMIGGTF